MAFPEEPDYTNYRYECPHCGVVYMEAGSVRKHEDYQKCRSCGKLASEPRPALVK